MKTFMTRLYPTKEYFTEDGVYIRPEASGGPSMYIRFGKVTIAVYTQDDGSVNITELNSKNFELTNGEFYPVKEIEFKV